MSNEKCKSPEEDLTAQLLEREKKRTLSWNTYDPFVDLRVEWRASMMRHLFHILPGQSILEIGAGNGRFTQALSAVTRNECKITAAVFSPEYEGEIRERVDVHSNIDVVYIDSFPGTLRGKKFDYVIANHLLGTKLRNLFLYMVKSFIKPGGGLLLFEPNPWNPYLQIRRIIQLLFKFLPHREAETLLLNRLKVFYVLSEIGYTQINALPYDFLYPPIPKFLLWPMRHLSLILENFPYVRNFAGALYIWARIPAPEEQKEPTLDLCEHNILFGKVSFVIPCHNEAMNISPLVTRLYDFYGKYIFEILIIDDNSTDRTTEIISGLAEKYKQVRFIKRLPPNGVGRALRDGVREAGGEYVVMMDSDFQHIIPEMRDLFDALVAGADVVIGSRFSRKSVLINYAFTKIIANRAFHLLANVLLGKRLRDISNNLKIFRREIIKKIVIESDDFAANAELGLKPLLYGYRVVEVPISWVDRSVNMGFSTFRIFKTGPNYWRILN